MYISVNDSKLCLSLDIKRSTPVNNVFFLNLCPPQGDNLTMLTCIIEKFVAKGCFQTPLLERAMPVHFPEPEIHLILVHHNLCIELQTEFETWSRIFQFFL